MLTFTFKDKEYSVSDSAFHNRFIKLPGGTMVVVDRFVGTYRPPRRLKVKELRYTEATEPNAPTIRNINFELTQEQVIKVRIWLDTHKLTCPHLAPQMAGAFGSPISYNFRTHGLGTSAEVVCNCGEKVDVTDSDNW